MLKYLLFLLLLPFIGKAQILDSLDIYDHKEFENQTLKVYSDSGLIQLQVIKPSLIKVSFFKRNDVESQDKFSSFDSTYVRITQNLESIFMQTDSILLVINKLDFSMKFQSLREQLYTSNQSISFLKDGLNLKFSREDEEFYNYKGKRLKAKEYSLKKLKSISSSKNYELLFDRNSKVSLDFRNPSSWNLKFDHSASFVFYFKIIL